MDELNSADSDDDGDSWSDCEVPEDVVVGCLFCATKFTSCDDLFAHCATSHHFDIVKLNAEMALDCFSYIRLINYIRKEKPSNVNVIMNPALLRHLIADDVYLKPVIEDDPLLMFDVEDLQAESSVRSSQNSIKHEELQHVDKNLHENNRLQKIEIRLRETEQQLAQAIDQIAQMKSVALEGFSRDGENMFVAGDATHPGDNLHAEGDGYFSSYAHYGIHHEMLQDKVRTSAYRDAILNNRSSFEGKTVLDVGCGTAILSMFAAQGGALQVFGVDQSEIIYRAMDIVRENKVEDRVTLLKGRMEDVHLKDKVDVIVSEWMGYFLLFESMLDTVIYARENHLKQGGLMLPNRCTINIAGICDPDAHSKLVSFWDNIYGFKMSCLKREVVQEANVEVVTSDKIITGPCLVQDLDLMVCSAKDVEFTAPFQLKVTVQGLLTGFVGWFDAYFDLPNMVTLSTSPFSSASHWKQTVFYLLTPLPVNKGDIIEGKISCKRLPQNQRCLKVHLDFNNAHQTYFLQ